MNNKWLINYLSTIAEKDAIFDIENAVIDDYAAGNVDDAYNIGFDDGIISLARDLLTEIGD